MVPNTPSLHQWMKSHYLQNEAMSTVSMTTDEEKESKTTLSRWKFLEFVSQFYNRKLYNLPSQIRIGCTQSSILPSVEIEQIYLWGYMKLHC